MNWRKFKFTGDYVILVTITEFSSTPSGKSWRKTPVSVSRKVVSPEWYTNYITAIPFFNNFDHGAYCRAKQGYTRAGYLPTEVVTVSPGRERKIVAEFDFLSRSELEEKAGWREREVLSMTNRFGLEIYNDWNGGRPIYGRRIEFHTDDAGVTASATWDTGLRRWVD